MSEAVYSEGDRVEVDMPCGWMPGIVRKVLPEYAWTGRTHYEVVGDFMVTIAPARTMRPVCNHGTHRSGGAK